MTRALPALLLACSLAGLPAHRADAAPPIPGAQSHSTAQELPPGRLVVDNKRISLTPIATSELTAKPQSAVSRPPGAVTRQGSTLQFSGSIDAPPLNAVVRREIQDLWRFAPHANGVNAMMPPRVRVQLRAQDGRTGFLSSVRSPQTRVPVEIRVTQELRVGARGERWYEGSVVLEIPVAGLTEAGTYSGRIELTQESL